MTTKNLNEVWENINKLGPRSKSILMEIINVDGQVTYDDREILNRSKRDFKCLYNGTDSNDFNSEHYNQATIHKSMLENNISDPLYNQNVTLNGNITFTEISEVVMKAKSRSAYGYDEIPYFVLKCPALIAILKELF